MFEHFLPINVNLAEPNPIGILRVETWHVIHSGLLKVMLMDDYRHSHNHQGVELGVIYGTGTFLFRLVTFYLLGRTN